jgi:hypothetical protein
MLEGRLERGQWSRGLPLRTPRLAVRPQSRFVPRHKVPRTTSIYVYIPTIYPRGGLTCDGTNRGKANVSEILNPLQTKL